MTRKHYPFLHSLANAASIILMGASLAAQAGQIPADPDGWNRDNVNVRILDVDGDFLGTWPATPIPADGAYESDIYDMTFMDGLSGETLMATLVAKNPPVGIPPGVKVLNDQGGKPSQPESCIMATAVGITCDSAFQTHKRYKVLMKPNMVDSAGSDSVDLVFNANNNGDPVEEYRVFQKINNWTDQRLAGFRLEVGFGIGGGFQKATDVPAAAASLGVEVDQYFTDPDKKTNFSHGLFGPIEPPNWNDPGAFTGGFFDDQSRAGFRIREVDTDTYESVADPVTGGIFGKYEDVLPEDPASPAGIAGYAQFGDWLPTIYMPRGVFFDDDDNPDTDDVLMAWWGYNTNCPTAPMPVNTGDYCWMYGHENYYNWIDNLPDPAALGFIKDVITTNYQPVSKTTFDAWATDSRYYVDTVDDLANLNLNYVVKVGTVDTNWPTWDIPSSTATFTIRVTPVPSANSTAEPGYIGTPHIPLTITSAIGTVEIRPSPGFVPGIDTLTLTVTDADLNVDDMVPDTVYVVVENLDTGEIEDNVTLTETGDATGMFAGTLPTGHGAADPGGDDNGIIFADYNQTVQVTYVDADPAAIMIASTVAVTGHDGSVRLSDPVFPNSDILIQVDDLDLVAGTITVNVVNQAEGESEVVTLFQSPVAGQYVGSLPSSKDVADAGDDNGTLVVAAGDVLVVTYIDAVAADGARDVARTDQVIVTAAPAVSGGGGGGCSTGNGSGVNPTLPALLLAILGLGWLRYRRSMRG